MSNLVDLNMERIKRNKLTPAMKAEFLGKYSSRFMRECMAKQMRMMSDDELKLNGIKKALEDASRG